MYNYYIHLTSKHIYLCILDKKSLSQAAHFQVIWNGLEIDVQVRVGEMWSDYEEYVDNTEETNSKRFNNLQII